MKFFLSLIGVIMIIEGLPYFLSPVSVKKIISFLFEIDDSSLRKIGFVMMVSGLVLAWLGTRFF